MDITPVIPIGKKVITSYGNFSFTVNNERLSTNIIITPDKVISWDITSIEELSINHLQDIIAVKPEILLIGCGDKHHILDNEIKSALKAYGITAETMQTGAACRTYNILLSEGRDLAAALIVV
jgi:uncharacterized protein